MATPTVYNYNLITNTANGVCNISALQKQINSNSDIIIAVKQIDIYGDDIKITMKDELSSTEEDALTIVVAAHTGVSEDTDPPVMSDGRPIVRADSRPLDFQTYFTMAGDDSTAGIGMGETLSWDFSNDNNIVTGDHIPNGMKCKEFLISFLCPVYMKDGCLYFFDAPWGSYVTMDVVIPPGQYYPNPAGSIPAYMLGLPGDDMYANTGSEYVAWACYLMKHKIYGNCPMGDELNAEGSSVNPVPPGWMIRGRVYTLSSDNTSKGYAELEVHRCHTRILPGQTVQDIINLH